MYNQLPLYSLPNYSWVKYSLIYFTEEVVVIYAHKHFSSEAINKDFINNIKNVLFDSDVRVNSIQTLNKVHEFDSGAKIFIFVTSNNNKSFDSIAKPNSSSNSKTKTFSSTAKVAQDSEAKTKTFYSNIKSVI